MKTRGSAKAFQALSGNLESYVVYCKSDDAFTSPETATGVNVRTTGNIQDVSQKNFEILIQTIGLRASPVILSEPAAVEELADEGAEEIDGEGFVWSFTTERADHFVLGADPVGLLKEELGGIVLQNGAVVHSAGVDQNIEFRVRTEHVD